MSRTPTLVTVIDGKRMVGNISVNDMIAQILTGESAVDIAQDMGIAPASISRIFRSETGVNMLRYKGLGRLIQDRSKIEIDKVTLTKMVGEDLVSEKRNDSKVGSRK